MGLFNTTSDRSNLININDHGYGAGGNIGPIYGSFGTSAALDNGKLVKARGFEIYGVGVGTPGVGVTVEGTKTWSIGVGQ